MLGLPLDGGAAVHCGYQRPGSEAASARVIVEVDRLGWGAAWRVPQRGRGGRLWGQAHEGDYDPGHAHPHRQSGAGHHVDHRVRLPGHRQIDSAPELCAFAVEPGVDLEELGFDER